MVGKNVDTQFSAIDIETNICSYIYISIFLLMFLSPFESAL